MCIKNQLNVADRGTKMSNLREKNKSIKTATTAAAAVVVGRIIRRSSSVVRQFIYHTIVI